MSDPDFVHIEKHIKNINFGRNKEWKNSLPLDELFNLEGELFNLEEELLFDPYIPFQEKTVLVQQEVNAFLLDKGQGKAKHSCKYCSKVFKNVGKPLLNHQAVCLFNPVITKNLKLSAFKDKVLKAKGTCPKCYTFFPSRLRQHASVCFLGISDFSKFLPKPECLYKNKPQPISYDTILLSELPFFSFEGPLTEKEIVQIEAFQSHIDQMIDFKEKNKNKFITLFLNINGIANKCYETDEI